MLNESKVSIQSAEQRPAQQIYVREKTIAHAIFIEKKEENSNPVKVRSAPIRCPLIGTAGVCSKQQDKESHHLRP